MLMEMSLETLFELLIYSAHESSVFMVDLIEHVIARLIWENVIEPTCSLISYQIFIFDYLNSYK